MATSRRPIKIIIPSDADKFSVPGGGGTKEFGTVDSETINSLDRQLVSIGQAFSAVLRGENTLPAVATVTLKTGAIAKSHRPTTLFNSKTCPIIGVQDFGQLLVSVEQKGLDELRREIRRSTKTHRAAISTIKSVDPFMATNSPIEIAPLQKQMKKQERSLKVRLFNHHNSQLDQRLANAFSSLTRALHLGEPKALNYAPGLRIYKVAAGNSDAMVALSGFVGVQKVSELPTYEVDTQAIYIGPATDKSIPLPSRGVEYPTVGLLDSGTDPDNPRLQAWVVGRDEDDVPRADQDNLHGSFIAGLLVNARGLNHGDPRFPSEHCKIFDAVVFPKRGGQPLREDELLDSIRRVVQKNHLQIKVWNLSISAVRAVCRDDAFSDFAMAIDDIQDKYGVTIVTCTGNIQDGATLRQWPVANGSLGEADRMFPAADSVRAISVGSIAHQHQHGSIVKSEEPSPFSRRGPGPAFIPKPELCHYGGNCDVSGSCQQVGILSVDHTSMIVEKIGTSYSTPLVTKILGSLHHTVLGSVSRNLAKALLIHSAVLGRQPIVAAELPYRGFGIPGNIETLLNCQPWQATLIFEPELEPVRRIFAKQSFPIPPCFRRPDRTVDGEIIITLVYDPPLDTNAGPEYCRINVDVSLGSYDLGPDQKRHHHGKVPLEPIDMKHAYERHQVEHGFKWSPVKVYRAILDGEDGDIWRIALRMVYRDNRVAGLPQNVAMIVTLQDPHKQKIQVYDEVVRELAKNAWASADLQVRERVRTETR